MFDQTDQANKQPIKPTTEPVPVSETTTINTSELSQSTSLNRSDSKFYISSTKSWFKRLVSLGMIILGVGVLIVAVIFLITKYLSHHQTRPSVQTAVPVATSTPATSSRPAILPQVPITPIASSTIATSSLADLQIEYLTFANFYKAPNFKITPQIDNYSLPLNVKIDVMNYYDTSRKLDLDPGLDSLNTNGFAIIKNPWSQTNSDFYSIYGKLDSNQIPLLVTSDFIIYNYQNIMKKAFKNIEADVFYKNLWDIEYQMYTTARNRYEARLSKIGDVNDSVLEGERLETAFFAISLELLKPQLNQISAGNTSSNSGAFTQADADNFYFVVPPYLRDDVLAEEKLIRAASARSAKSPVLLYQRNYQDFVVPDEYNSNPKLHNFYLTTKWFNSVFPLNYQGADCPDCLLDHADWRINMIAASLISRDFSLSSDLTNKWARIYKVVAYFKGLRDDLSFVNYRDSLQATFGNNYQIDQLFDDQNPQASANLEKLRTKLLSYNFPAISGGLDRQASSTRPFVGFQMLAQSYWPNDYIFSHLTTPSVGSYLGTTTDLFRLPQNNLTACRDLATNSLVRCRGIALDPINLVQTISNNAYFSENTNYQGYQVAATKLRQDIGATQLNHLNNYWTDFSLLKSFLSVPSDQKPVFAKTAAWQNHEINTAASAWINFQLPLADFSTVPLIDRTGIDQSIQLNQNAYVEPNLNLINELLVNNNMLLGMLSVLRLNQESPEATQSIQNLSTSLTTLRQIEVKELTGQILNNADNQMIVDFTKQFKLMPQTTADQRLRLNSPQPLIKGLQESLSQPALMVLIHRDGNNDIFSVGPVWNYQESK